MIRIALDAMGGDNAPLEIVEGGLQALAEQDSLKLLLVGNREILKKQLAGKKYNSERLEIVHAPEVITDDDSPVLAVRRKRNSSMIIALQLVTEKKADVAVSAGNTGALMAGSLLTCGRLPGIERPALTIIVPTFDGGGVVLLDAGANMDAKPEHLLQYGLMGRIYAREILGKSAPRVALLNVGREEKKGNEQVKKAYQLCKEKLSGFAGNIEARDIMAGEADVVICDGFAGNIVLKTIEGVALGLFAALREEFTAGLRNKMGAVLLMPGLRKIRRKLDYAEYGGAPLLGVGEACIKCHGSSKAKAIRNAIITQAFPFAERNVNGIIEKEIAELSL